MNLFQLDILFSEIYIPHGHCFLWNPALVWLHIVSDSLISLSYFSIPLSLIFFVKKRKDIPYPGIFVLFSAFIIACGMSHVLEIWTLWHPDYWVSGSVKLLTAIISMITALALIPVIPGALAIPSADELKATTEDLQRTKQELEQRVDERTRALKVSEERLLLAVEGSGDGLWDWNIQTEEVYFSSAWFEMLGYEPGELDEHFKAWKSLIHPDDYPMVMETLQGHLADSSQPYSFDYRLRTKLGDWKWIGSYGKVVAFDQDGKPLRMAGTHKDISGRKKKELIIANSLSEKDVLLKEIHHRVKNNLQIIRSLLSLQAKKAKDNSVITILKESQDRILSMALIHDKLYHSTNFSYIDFGDYLKDLFVQISRSYRTLSRNIDFKNDIHEHLYLDIDVAIPCGLIINEIVTNSLKHAFPSQKTGSISVNLSIVESYGFIIELADDGVGFPTHIDWGKTTTLGLQMINVLVNQISGEIKSYSSSGAKYEIKVPFQSCMGQG